MMVRTLLLGIFLSFPVIIAAKDWQTRFEKSNGLRTPRYVETIAFAKKLADASSFVEYKPFGTSPQGRELPLLIVDLNGNFDPQSVRASGNVVVLIQAGIHAGESDGKDAGLMLVRDWIIRNRFPGELQNITLLFIPIFNVDGHERFGLFNRINQNGPEETGWRVTAQNLNLNRDYLKADTPEMQAWLRLYTRWLPEFFVDCHVTDGADYQYTVTYKMPTQGTAAPAITGWMKNDFLPPVRQAMQQAGFPIIQYIFFRKRHDVLSGLESWAESPRFSQGYVALHNRAGLLIETHMLKNYKTRVHGTYQMLLHTLRTVDRQKEKLQQAVRESERFTASNAFREEPFPLRWKDTDDSVMIDFLGVEYEIVHSDISGGDWFRYYPDRPETFRIPYYYHQEPTVTVRLPRAYIVPVEWRTVIERLQLHGVKMEQLHSAKKYRIQTCKFKNAEWRRTPYEGRHPLSFETDLINEERVFPSGSVIIPLDQPAARVAINILEPQAPDSYVSWGFFDAIFERREYAESYVLEELARNMLAEDANLKTEFLNKISSDSAFAKSPSARLMFFYERSPYFDRRWNIYPVGRITDAD